MASLIGLAAWTTVVFAAGWIVAMLMGSANIDYRSAYRSGRRAARRERRLANAAQATNEAVGVRQEEIL